MFVGLFATWALPVADERRVAELDLLVVGDLLVLDEALLVEVVVTFFFLDESRNGIQPITSVTRPTVASLIGQISR